MKIILMILWDMKKMISTSLLNHPRSMLKLTMLEKNQHSLLKVNKDKLDTK